MLMKYLGIGFGVTVILFGVYFYWSQAKISTQNKKLVANEITIKTQELVITDIKDDINTIKDINSELNSVQESFTDNTRRLNESLRGLERYAVEKPLMVERLINESMRLRIRCFALATGEKALKNEENAVCAHLL